MFEEMFDEFNGLIRELDFIKPDSIAAQICFSKKLTYDEKVDWLDKLYEFCQNNYCGSDIVSKVEDIAAYYQLTVGNLYNRLLDNKDEQFKFKVTMFDKSMSDKDETDVSFYDTLDKALEVVPTRKNAIINIEASKILDNEDLKAARTRFIYCNNKWIYDTSFNIKNM